MKTQTAINPIRLFYSYSHKDEKYRKILENHLTILRKQNIIQEWHDRKIIPSMDWASEIDKNLENSQIILLLISSDFLASKYCYDIEMKRALEKHEKGEAKVIPIMLRPVDIEGAPFSKIQALPTDSIPVTMFKNQDTAWVDISKGIRKVCGNCQSSLSLDSVKTPEPKTNEDVKLITKSRGVVLGNRVFVRSGPTVGAKWVVKLDQGEEVEVLESINTEAQWEFQLINDIDFKSENGNSYKLKAGRGLIISGEGNNVYRVEINRSYGTDIGFIPKDLLNHLYPAKWYHIKKNLLKGWIFHRYLRVY